MGEIRNPRDIFIGESEGNQQAWCLLVSFRVEYMNREFKTGVLTWELSVDCFWNVIAHAQKTDFVFRRNGRVHLNRQGLQFSRLLAVEMCASAVVMLHTPCFEVVWRVLGTHFIRQFPLHLPSRASPYAITFHLHCTTTARADWILNTDFEYYNYGCTCMYSIGKVK